MRATSIKHYGLAVAVIAVVALLSAAGADASSLTYNDRASGFDGVPAMSWLTGDLVSGANILQSPDITGLRFDDAGAARALARSAPPIPGPGLGWQQAHYSSLPEGFSTSLAGGRGGNSFDTVLLSGSVAQPPPEPNQTGTGLTLFMRELLIGLTVVEVASSLGRAVPQPGMLILLGSGLVVLAYGIRRMTGRQGSEGEDDGQAPTLLMNAEPEADCTQPDLHGSVPPLFRQHPSGRRDTISVSQRS